MLVSLIRATNGHDLDAIVDCFSPNYRNETPVHPTRGFVGGDQVRRNWQQILTSVPDVAIEVTRFVVGGDTIWSEMEMRGTRRDGSQHLMRGVVIFGVSGGRAEWASFYMEPVQEIDGDVNEAVKNAISPQTEAKP